jgi:hypothetical protein
MEGGILETTTMPFLIPYITLNPFIIFCPHVFKIPYHLFTRIFLLQSLTTPLKDPKLLNEPSDLLQFKRIGTTIKIRVHKIINSLLLTLHGYLNLKKENSRIQIF